MNLTERDGDRDREKDRDRDREKDRDRQTERETQRERERQRERDRETETETETDRDRERQRQWQRQTETERDRERNISIILDQLDSWVHMLQSYIRSSVQAFVHTCSHIGLYQNIHHAAVLQYNDGLVHGRILKGVTGSKPFSLTESMIIYRLYKIENVQNYINFHLNSPEYSIFSMSIPSGVRRR